MARKLYFRFKSALKAVTRAYSLRRARLDAYLDAIFCHLFDDLEHFSKLYPFFRPHLLRWFFWFFLVPGFTLGLYLFFCVYRLFYENGDDPEFFWNLHGLFVKNPIVVFYLLYRFSETSCWHASIFLSEFIAYYNFAMLSEPSYIASFFWTLDDFVIQSPSKTYALFQDHIEKQEVPTIPFYPFMVEFPELYSDGYRRRLEILNSYEFSQLLADIYGFPEVAFEAGEDIIITIIVLPFYILVDRSDIVLLGPWLDFFDYAIVQRVIRIFSYLFFTPTYNYIAGWLEFIPPMTFIPESFSTFFHLVYDVVRAHFHAFSYVIDVRFFLVQLANWTDAVALHSSYFWYYASFVLALVYGVPFFIVSYLAIYLSLFFTPLKLIVRGYVSWGLSKLYWYIYPTFTLLEQSLGADETLAHPATAKLLFHLSEAWILFIPITYLLPVLYLFFLLVVFLWWLLFKPLFFAYSLVYDRKVSEFRPYGDIKEIILTQVLLFQQVWHFKVYLLREFGSFLLYHTRMIFIAARSPDDSVYWKSWEELTEPMREIFFQEQKELNDWFERDFKACEEADYEEHGDMILEDDERLAQQNLEHEDLAVWSTMGNSPELTTPYPHFATFIRLTLRFFGFVWPIVAVFGVWVRGDYMRLFIDGIAANVIIPFAVSEDLSQVETPEHVKTDTYMFFDRYKMRWVPEYGAEFIYMPSEVTANTYSYALTVMGAFHWFFFGFMIVVGVIGVGWLALRTFREVVNAYWTAAFFSVVYAIIIVFGDSFGFGLLDYAIPLAGVLESYGQYLDGWAAETGLTDAFYEFRYYALDHYYSFRRYRRYNYGKTRRKRRKIAHKFFLVVGTLYILYYPTMNAGQVEEPWLHANWFDRFLTWLKSDPARQESGRYRYPIVSPLHDAFTSGFLRARLWATKIRKRFGGGGPEE